jgi:hypothetical protein
LHQNKGNDHARGHIGTELQNKSESVFSVTKSTDNKELSIFEAEFCRGKEPEPFAFRINESGIPEIVEYETGNKKGFSQEFTEEKLYFLIQESFKTAPVDGIFYGELVNQMKVNYYQCYSPNKIGDNKAKELITMCKNYKMINQTGSKKPYILNKDYNKPISLV